MNSQTRSKTETITDGKQPSVAVIDHVARVAGVDPLELEPLYDAIDPDVLDTVCTAAGFTTLEFDYCGYTVRLRRAEENVQIDLESELPDPTRSSDTVDSEPSA